MLACGDTPAPTGVDNGGVSATDPTTRVPLEEGSAEERLMSGEAWAEFCDRMKAAGERILGDEFPGSPRERAEGYRYLTRLMIQSLQWRIEFSDPDFPSFWRHDDDVAKWGGPNVDNAYLRARVSSDGTYRVWGNIGQARDVVIGTGNGDMHEEKYGVYGDLTLADIAVDPNGDFEIILSADERSGNWIRLEPDVEYINARIYYSDWDNDTPAQLFITRIGNEGRSPDPITPERLAIGLDAAANWAESALVYWNDYLVRTRAKGVDNFFQEAQSVAGGAPALRYGFGFFDLEPEQAMIIESKLPKASYWGYQWYTLGWFESPDFGNRMTSLNGDQMHVDSDARIRLVVAHQDPGAPNWIDTTGLSEGMITYRYLLATEAPVPTATVVPLSEIWRHLPEDTPRVSPEERREQIFRRQMHVQRRFRR